MESLKLGLEQMEVEEGCRSGTGVEEAPRRDEASVGENERTVEGGGGGILEVIIRKIEEIRSKIGGSFLMRNSISGEIRLTEEIGKKEEEEEVVKLEDVVMGSDEVVVEIEAGRGMTEDDSKSIGSISSRETGTGYAFLDAIEEEKEDTEAERKLEENRKRKRGEEKKVLRVKGLKVMPGWEERAKMSREDQRWSRVVETVVDGVKVQEKRKIPLPEEYELGLDVRGMGLNSSNRKTHNF